MTRTAKLLMATALMALTAAASSIHRHKTPIANVSGSAKDLIPWRHDLSAAEREGSAAKKPLLLEFQASWCPDCQALEQQTWTKPSVASALQAYIPVSIDIDAS